MTVVQIVAFAATAWVRRSDPGRAVMSALLMGIGYSN